MSYDTAIYEYGGFSSAKESVAISSYWYLRGGLF